ncbi:hypothetical protein AVEN_151385-1 [Araneus ventricosus]|uniref:Uncharacterized protein n=1 Tax=Araneus ventricosus TaxID=182803 RepID=A0A4Y2CAU8_ARAVE|nr:hypothetical protein AVEN_151385-1 [Araneus ventricosus]
MASSDLFLSNIMSRDQPYSQAILEISLLHRFLSKNDRKCRGRGYQKTPLLLGRSFGRRVLSNVTLRSLEQYSAEPTFNEIVSLAQIRRLEVDKNGIDELVEENNQELTTE